MKNYWYLLPSLLVCYGLAVYKITNTGLPEYDSVRNFFIVQAMTEGDFSEFYHHGSPTFYLFFWVVANFSNNAHVWLAVNAGLQTFALAVFAIRFANIFQYNRWWQMAWVLFVGSGTYWVYCTRSFAIESLTMAVFACLFWFYTQPHFALLNLQSKQPARYFWLCFALLLTINYKILLFLPVFIVAQTLVCENLTTKHLVNNRLKSILQILILLALPFTVLWLLGIILGVSWKTYPATWYFLLFAKNSNSNVWREVSTFSWDIDFYLQYLLYFESPFLLLGLLLFLAFYWIEPKPKLKQLAAIKILLITVLTLAGMSVLPKAPRGILLILPLLYGLAFEGVFQLFNFKLAKFLKLSKFFEKLRLSTSATIANVTTFLLFFFLFFSQYQNLQTHIYQDTTTNYNQISNALAAEKDVKLLTTVGINAKFFLPNSLSFKTLHFAHEIDSFRKQGYTHLLIDDYYKVVKATSFDSLAAKYEKQTILALPEKTLLDPMLHLEHCEFTGHTFQEALLNQQKMEKEKVQLKLVRF